jgi:hypothetical protein
MRLVHEQEHEHDYERDYFDNNSIISTQRLL